jgi:hypothetical protein
LVVGLYLCARQFLLPGIRLWKDQREIDQSLLEISAYQQIAKYDPNAYQEIRAEILDSLRKGESQPQSIARGRRLILGLVKKYIPRASDDAIIGYVNAMIQEIEELAAKDPELCYQFLFPEKYGTPDTTKHLKPETQRADLNALAEVIRTAVEKPQAEPDKVAGEAVVRKVLNTYYETRGDDVNLLKDPFAPGVDKCKVCNLVAVLYREIVNLPKEKSSLALRYMLSARQ